MPETKHRVILDTNLWISFLVTKNWTKLDKFVANDELVLLFSRELLDEFIEVARRPKFKKYFPLSDLENLLTEIRNKAEFVDVTSSVTACRDPKDNFLLALSTEGNATHLITGDKDLLDIGTFGNTVILTIADYLTTPQAYVGSK